MAIRTYALICVSLLALAGCSYSTQMVNDKGVTVDCKASGLGPISGTAALAARDSCVNKYKALGYHEATSP
jgi:hypothetical protein